jgi:hypothetical protein
MGCGQDVGNTLGLMPAVSAIGYRLLAKRWLSAIGEALDLLFAICYWSFLCGEVLWRKSF